MVARRTRAKLVRLTAEEFAEIESRARAVGTVPARYLRNRALDADPAAATSANNGHLLHTLATVGADLKTLLRSVNDDTTRTRIDVVLGEIVAILRQLTRLEHS